MTHTARAILKQALRLDPVQRAELINSLFQSFDTAPDARLDAEWATEAEDRIDAARSGRIPSAPAKTVFARIAKSKR